MTKMIKKKEEDLKVYDKNFNIYNICRKILQTEKIRGFILENNKADVNLIN